MESEPIKLTKQEEELAIYYAEAMNAEDYEQALSYISELIKLREHNPVYYLWLGDCYRVSAQVDNALDSYRKALDLDGKYYTVGDDFREDAERHIKGLELIKKATEACQAKQYEEAIRWIDDFIKIDLDWGDIYALRGYCNDLLGNRVLAIKDYSLSLKRRLSEQARPSVENNIKPTELKSLHLMVTEMESDKSEDDTIFLQEYLKLLKSIEERLTFCPEISELPGFDRFCQDIDELKKISMRSPGKALLIGIDSEGIFAVTQEELVNRKQKHPDSECIFSSKVTDIDQSQSSTVNARLGSRLASKDVPVSDSKDKERARKRDYYKRNKARLSGNQNKYDDEHRVQIHFKNKFYQMIKTHGVNKTYMIEDVKDLATEDTVYHQLRSDY